VNLIESISNFLETNYSIKHEIVDALEMARDLSGSHNLRSMYRRRSGEEKQVFAQLKKLLHEGIYHLKLIR